MKGEIFLDLYTLCTLKAKFVFFRWRWNFAPETALNKLFSSKIKHLSKHLTSLCDTYVSYSFLSSGNPNAVNDIGSIL